MAARRRPINKLDLPPQAGFRDRILVNIVLVTKGFDANSVSGRARSSHGTAKLRSAVGALKFRRPSLCERSGSGSYSLGGERVYDPSASLRAGSVPGSSDPRQRYCANLGHRQDDETGTYTGGSPDGDGLANMRARYYQPGTGRFVSEDPARDGANWYGYCAGDPITLTDSDGRMSVRDGVELFLLIQAVALSVVLAKHSRVVACYLLSGMIFMSAWVGVEKCTNYFGDGSGQPGWHGSPEADVSRLFCGAAVTMVGMLAGGDMLSEGQGGCKALLMYEAHALILEIFLITEGLLGGY